MLYALDEPDYTIKDHLDQWLKRDWDGKTKQARQIRIELAKAA